MKDQKEKVSELTEKEGIRQREDFYKMKNYEDKIYSLG